MNAPLKCHRVLAQGMVTNDMRPLEKPGKTHHPAGNHSLIPVGQVELLKRHTVFEQGMDGASRMQGDRTWCEWIHAC